ncbi:restriction endonuclease subunit S [Enterococcus faecalis]|uniref:restriction endonuclease subunit S n=1 Tax=Enterococcus faecalis TaxID=1351 RepID=UPI000CF19C60|nr:restriction endonuclease subunit S [Enterococcus faecalis]PQB43866.1 restriction endonuclease subunit S [Enterococcus faecalis]
MSNDIQPEIRFPGFTEDWEQRKFGEMLVNLEAGVSVNSSDYDTGYFILKTSAIKMGNIDLLEVKSIVSEEVARAKTPLIKNSIIISRMNTPELVGASGLVRESIDNIFLPDRLWQGQVAGNFSPEWLIQSINIAANIKKIRDLATGTSGSMKNISKKSMLDLIINVPTLEEQQKIGSFFKQLDDVISLHQLKLDLLKEQKKGFLQKMFPKNGAKVPEIRFPGFTEDWEERRLQEVVDRYDNLRIPITASKRVAGNTPYYGANGIQGYVEGYTHDGEFILVAEDGANDLKNYPVQYVDGKVWVNNHAHVIQAKENLADNMFLMNAIRSINIEPFLVGGGRAKLNADVLMKLEVIIPLKSEQQKIGNFFKQLDDTITLHQRKLDLLKETKKGFLQKMFV